MRLICVGVIAMLAGCHPRRSGATAEATTLQDLPRQVRIEVLNAGGGPGAARVGAVLLRRARLDVVSYGNADSARSGRQHNQVLVRRGDTTGVGRIVEVLGTADVVVAPDSTLLLDLTVLLGADFGRRTGVAR